MAPSLVAPHIDLSAISHRRVGALKKPVLKKVKARPMPAAAEPASVSAPPALAVAGPSQSAPRPCSRPECKQMIVEGAYKMCPACRAKARAQYERQRNASGKRKADESPSPAPSAKKPFVPVAASPVRMHFFMTRSGGSPCLLQRGTDEHSNSTPARSPSPIPIPSSPGLSSVQATSPPITGETKPCSRCKCAVPADYQWKQCEPCRARGREEMRRHNERVKERKSILLGGGNADELAAVKLKHHLVSAPDLSPAEAALDVRPRLPDVSRVLTHTSAECDGIGRVSGCV
jgi:hypothetical protein